MAALTPLQLRFRDAMASLGAAVNVVTSTGEAGQVGFTATAVCGLTDTPPRLAVCMNRRSSQHDIVRANGALCVNTLSAGHEDLSKVFAGMSELDGERRFAAASWTTALTGSPVLADALASFDCEIDAVHEVGSHSLFVCQVVHIERREGDGLAYFRRAYHALNAASAD
ncbi:MAG: flavin reductase [Rhodovulum sulfidophilum]|uniref:Flavin reductase n=1 Tax=Rhodovulum sulfidophilum TaxID=35806 RepID=A0A2W5MY09_RHOSU|nr:MAG: flavin reductase [Rhodovulum sulfidophilum]